MVDARLNTLRDLVRDTEEEKRKYADMKILIKALSAEVDFIAIPGEEQALRKDEAIAILVKWAKAHGNKFPRLNDLSNAQRNLIKSVGGISAVKASIKELGGLKVL